jgi:hypothetical protein
MQPHGQWATDLVDEKSNVEIIEGEIIDGYSVYQDLRTDLPLSLGEVLGVFGSFPPYSILFGICEDGLPLMLNLKDPRPGSILIEGDSRSGKTQVLKTVLASAAELNPVDRVNFCVITPHPDEMAELFNYPHCQGLSAPFERQASEIILELSALTEQRRYGRERGPSLILAIDDFGALVGEHLDYEVLIHLRWLISKGPGSQIWTVATLPNRSTASVDSQSLSLFQTRILNGTKAKSFDLLDPKDSTAITYPNRSFGFTTQINRQTIRFIPLNIG